MVAVRRLRAALIAAAAMLAAGCYDSFDAPADKAAEAEKADITIADLVAMYRGSRVEISENLVISGRVTSSDRAGNFYRSLMVEQVPAAAGEAGEAGKAVVGETDAAAVGEKVASEAVGERVAAVEIRVALTEMHNIWPVGCGVTVRLQGLAMGESMGVKCIGLPAAEYSYNPVEYIGSRVEADRIIARTHGPEPFGIPNLYAPMLERQMCGRIVRVVALVPSESGGAAEEGAEVRRWGGTNLFEDDEDGTRIAVMVSDYADFASHAVREGRVAVTGILQYGRPEGADEDMFILKPRDEGDILY